MLERAMLLRLNLVKVIGCIFFLCSIILGADNTPIPAKQGWRLTFSDEFNRPVLNDMYWYSAYRSGRKEYFKRIGKESRWYDSNACYVIEKGILKLRISETMPLRTDKGARCVSSIQTSDHRFGGTTKEFQVLDKFAQKYGWFEIRCRMPKGSGLHSAFWLLQTDPTKQEYAEDGRRRTVGEGIVEIDIFEQLGKKCESKIIDFNVHFTKTGAYEYKMAFDPSEDFHVWALEWSEGKLIWYLDGEKIRAYEGDTPKEKMFILLGLYQGAVPGWVGPTDPNMPYPRDYEIDYVRVYARCDK